MTLRMCVSLYGAPHWAGPALRPSVVWPNVLPGAQERVRATDKYLTFWNSLLTWRLGIARPLGRDGVSECLDVIRSRTNTWAILSTLTT